MKLILASLVAAVASGFTLHGNWQHREDFVASSQGAAASEPHVVHFAVKQKNLDRVEKILLEVSDPSSPKYGQHLTHKEVHEMTANPEATAAIEAFCKENGLEIRKVTEYGEYVEAVAPVGTWNKVLDMELLRVERAGDKESVLRARHYTMPDSLRGHVAHIMGVVELPTRAAPATRYDVIPENDPRLAVQATGSDYPCHSMMTPICWNYYYNQTDTNAKGQTQMIFGQVPYVISLTDLSTFAASSSMSPQTFDCPTGGCDGDTGCQGYDPDMKGKGYLCVEGDLDVQWISATGRDANNIFYRVSNLETPFLEFITHISSMSSPPGVVSISYGSYEYEMDHAIMDQFTTEAMKLGAQGVSILAANGDDGVAGYKARTDTAQCKYTTSFPGTSPYVTSVGGTQNAENDPEDHQVHTLEEWAANAPDQQGPFFKATTAGGFSNYYPVPEYQKGAVEGYFATAESKRALPGFNTTGRGMPDVSINAIQFHVFITSFTCMVTGTSGSSPGLAGMISVLNARRSDKGQGKLGFLNPLLYSAKPVFDVTTGWNNCTAVPEFCCKEGFTAAAGWDPLTGVGSPRFNLMAAAVGL